MHEVDFTNCDLTSAVITACDLQDAKFENTLLESADLRTSFHYSIDPNLNKIRKASFSVSSIEGLLHTYNIRIDRKT